MKKSFDISKFLKEHIITTGIIDTNKAWLKESDDDKYTHIGYGHYKLKGKEDDKNATVFSKDDNGKYIASSNADKTSNTSTKPKVNIFDKPKSDKSSEPDYDKYTNKSKTMTDFFKGGLSIDGLKKVAAKNFDSEIATERDLDGFLNNKFMQDAMADEHGVDRDTLISKVKDLKTALFGGEYSDDTNTSKKVSSTKITDLMPNANPKTFSGKSDIGKLSPKQKSAISMKIDELDRISKEARAKGENAPNYNLCKITVPGTNLYCDDNLGIPRADMPQFKGKPQPMSPASKMKVDVNGEVDTEPLFKKMLNKKGIKTSQTEIPSDALKATQSELVGAKVAGMTKALEVNPNNPGITAPIYVSRDGYVIDGHHRWAAVTSMAIKNGKPANMKVIVIDDDAQNIIPMANKFAQDIGIAAKKADINKESKKTTSLMKMIKEAIGNPDKEIAYYTGTRATAVAEFIKLHNIDADKLSSFIRKGNLKDRMQFVTALAGTPNNKTQREIIQKFGKEKNETISESTRDDDYAYELQQQVISALKGKNIKGWKLSTDERSGTFEFNKAGIDMYMFITPMWDGTKHIPFNAFNKDGDVLEDIEKSVGNILPFTPQYNTSDIKRSIQVITNALIKAEKLYKKQ